MRHPWIKSTIHRHERDGVRDWTRATSHSPTPLQRGCRRGLDLAHSCTSFGSRPKLFNAGHESLKSIQERPERPSIPVVWRPHGSL